MENIHNLKLSYNNTNIYNLKEKINVSFELFPPKDIILEKFFLESVKKLDLLNPIFFSVTNSVEKKNKKKTFLYIKKASFITKASLYPHVTSLGSNLNELKQIAQFYWKEGIRNIVALRGDIPKNYSGPLIYASDLIYLFKKIENFNILIAAYPELHPESKNIQEDLINLKKKIDAGASQAITQFFFDVEKFLIFRDYCHKNSINIKIIPGILPILNIKQLKRFSSMTNVYIPNWIFKVFKKYEHDKLMCQNISINIIVDLIYKLYINGIRDFHLYTLNRYNLSINILKRLNIFSI